MSGDVLSDALIREELWAIRRLCDQGLAGDGAALAEFGRRFHALGPKLRGKEQEVAKAMKELEERERSACVAWARDAGYIAQVDGSEAVDIAALDAWMERAQRAAQEGAELREELAAAKRKLALLGAEPTG